MSRLRTDIWCSAFLRRLNDRGTNAMLVRRGDPIAGQVWIEFDHLDGASTLLAPAPALAALDVSENDVVFQVLLRKVSPLDVTARLNREAEFDPDFWHIAVESRKLDDQLHIIDERRA